LSYAAFCEIRHILFEGDLAATSGSALSFQGNCSSCTVDHCRIGNFPESGVRFEGDSQHPMSSNTIRDCHFIGNLGDQLFSLNHNDDCSHWIIKDNILRHNASEALAHSFRIGYVDQGQSYRLRESTT
jgi:predicted outer membrane repeat protein